MSQFPHFRFRRLRSSETVRSLVRETELSLADLIQPLFLVPGSGIVNPISSLPGQAQRSIDTALEYGRELSDLGITSLLLFGLPAFKDETGSAAWQPDGIIQETIHAFKRELPHMLVITDLCYCEYTSHGHCGILKDGDVDNDATLEILARQAVSHAEAGADVIAPSGMMDGMVAAIRGSLDENRFQNLPIMSYAAKYASACYGPFREAADCAPSEGDRRSYQMDPANTDEAMREVLADLEEGADIVMVKPALMYLDIIHRVKEEFRVPTAAYNVSGEYAMIKAAAANGWIDEKRVMLESLLSMKRAGADIIISYFAEQVAKTCTAGGKIQLG
ncbi:MAG: porphobilinogen synthase [Bdellovibrionota bacterium]|jgi:porphobilinogen synthase